jgi:FlaA1/EpsC-like NDP-sugar epimerase
VNILKLINREQPLFVSDISKNSKFLQDEISRSRFLVIGGAGSIGQAVVKELFKRNPRVLHVVNISNLVELMRNLRSSVVYIEGDFKTFAIDCGSL